MFRDLYLWLVQQRLEMADAKRALAEQVENPQPGAIAEALVNLDEFHERTVSRRAFAHKCDPARAARRFRRRSAWANRPARASPDLNFAAIAMAVIDAPPYLSTPVSGTTSTIGNMKLDIRLLAEEQLFQWLLSVARRADQLARFCVALPDVDRRIWLRAEFEVFERLETAGRVRLME
jgi:hypothetical protein